MYGDHCWYDLHSSEVLTITSITIINVILIVDVPECLPLILELIWNNKPMIFTKSQK